jgi:hypothetical protein
MQRLWEQVSTLLTGHKETQCAQHVMHTALQDLMSSVNALVRRLKEPSDPAAPQHRLEEPPRAATSKPSVLPRSIRDSFPHSPDSDWTDLMAFRLDPCKLYLLVPPFAVPVGAHGDEDFQDLRVGSDGTLQVPRCSLTRCRRGLSRNCSVLSRVPTCS